MNIDKLHQAQSIQRRLDRLKREKSLWEYQTRPDVHVPLSFRMGGDLECVPAHVFDSFKSACLASLQQEIDELDAKFAAL